MSDAEMDRRKSAFSIIDLWNWLKRGGKNRRQPAHVQLFEKAIAKAEITVRCASESKKRLDEAIGGFADDA